MIDVSIIIVNFKSKDVLLRCINSIYASKTKFKLEIIVVDNDKTNSLKKTLSKKFNKVAYVKSFNNLGFGAGNNLGASKAGGEYLFFLNPDTEVYPNTLDVLLKFLKNNKHAGIVSPLVLNSNAETFSLQGYKELTPLNSLVSFSFLRKLFPSSSSFENYSLKDWNKKPIREVASVYGAALVISKELFKKINGFDEQFFLYFEENDISKRVSRLGYKLFINSNSKVIHKVGQSTKQFSKRDKVFAKSRFLYLKKHHGFIRALIVDLLLKINKANIFIAAILAISFYLRTLNISQSMQFIGDQGWFYISARNLLVEGNIPLVGITSSHVWLHQGPLWTYMLSIALFVFKFNPVGGAYLTALIGVMSTCLLYKIGSKMFSVRVGIISAVLYSVSPLIVFWERIPFDPSVIPLFTILYIFAMYKWIKGTREYFPVILFLLAVLYNLELATFTLFFPFALTFIYGFWKNKTFFRKVKSTKFIFYSFLAGLIPMIPVVIYDFSHGFKQTIVFLGWTFYKPLSFLLHGAVSRGENNFGNLFLFLSANLEKLILANNFYISLLIFILSLGYLIFITVRKRRIETGLLLFLLFFAISGVIINQTPSDAYLPILFPFLIFLIAVFFDFLFSMSKLAAILVAIIFCFNIYYVANADLKNDLSVRINAINKIITLTKDKNYNLVGKGPGSQFESFTMNYEYLLWWKGKPVSKNKEKLKIEISEDSKGIHVKKR